MQILQKLNNFGRYSVHAQNAPQCISVHPVVGLGQVNEGKVQLGTLAAMRRIRQLVQHKHGINGALARAKPTLRLVQVGSHYLVRPMHEQHGIHLARDAEETDPP